MSDESVESAKRVLEPGERISEVLFGLIMVLTFTGSLSVANASRGEVRTMLIGALGCNLAWGVIDGIFYLMGCLSEQGRGIRALRSLRNARTPAEGQRVIAAALPPLVAEALGPEDYEPLRRKLLQLPEPPAHPRLHAQQWMGAVAVFLWVFLVTFPVAVPFLYMDDVGRALRISNAIAVGLLFVCGHAFGRIAGYRGRPFL